MKLLLMLSGYSCVIPAFPWERFMRTKGCVLGLYGSAVIVVTAVGLLIKLNAVDNVKTLCDVKSVMY